VECIWIRKQKIVLFPKLEFAHKTLAALAENLPRFLATKGVGVVFHPLLLSLFFPQTPLLASSFLLPF
jgi:hypothetical protein